MRTYLKSLALAGGLLMMTACASTLEADGRLDTARDRVEAASEYGTSRTAYTRASGFLDNAESALETGDATAYDKNVELSDAYAQVAIAQGEGDAAREMAESMEGELGDAQDRASQLMAELEAARNAQRPGNDAMNQTLALLAGTMKCTRTNRGSGSVTLTCPGLGFGFDQAQLNAATDARLTALAEFMKAHGGVSVELVGHTDTTGPEGWNQTLSEQRAASASAFLQDAGINASRIATSGQGESQPIASNDTRQGRAENRRVDVVLRGVSTMASGQDI